jgi:endonuclease/exonuclease/phosphatase family metal-dependent hydrolase
LPNFTLVTINILNDLSLWRQRRVLLVEQLTALAPDLIALQEVSLKGESSNAHWLADQLNQTQELTEKGPPYQVFLCPKTGIFSKKEGIAILSRLPVKHHESLDLLSQNRVAQLVCVRINNRYFLLVNGHFYWQPGASKARQKQIELILDFLDTQPVDQPIVVCGDFNSIPETPAIERMCQYFDSAYKFANNYEPDYTCPTPLPKPISIQLRTQIVWRLGLRSKPDPEWRGTLDYIFVDPRLLTQECRIVLNQPAPDNPEIYPSDHFGLWATIKVNE